MGIWSEFSDTCTEELEMLWQQDRTRPYRYVDDDNGESFSIDLSTLTRISIKSGKNASVNAI